MLLRSIFLIAATFIFFQTQGQDKVDPDFTSYHITDLQERMEQSGRGWLPFFQGQNVLAGIYKLRAQSRDTQPAHDTDEVYYIVSGKAGFIVGGDTTSVSAGSILFVKAEIEHRFIQIEEDITMVVFFDQ